MMKLRLISTRKRNLTIFSIMALMTLCFMVFHSVNGVLVYPEDGVVLVKGKENDE